MYWGSGIFLTHEEIFTKYSRKKKPMTIFEQVRSLCTKQFIFTRTIEIMTGVTFFTYFKDVDISLWIYFSFLPFYCGFQSFYENNKKRKRKKKDVKNFSFFFLFNLKMNFSKWQISLHFLNFFLSSKSQKCFLCGVLLSYCI